MNHQGDLDRRTFLKLGGAMGAQLAAGSALFAVGCDLSPYGPLQDPDENGIRLPPGFQSRVLAQTGEPVGSSGYVWHLFPDGGATFRTRDGWIYVSNSEKTTNGGVGALRFDRRGEIIDAYPICAGTRRNCAGGATPWGTWLSCEEVKTGWVWECDPTGVERAKIRIGMGRFMHEAVAVDPVGRCFYLTEDRTDSGFYRYSPNTWGDLRSGLLEIAEIHDGDRVRWHAVPNPIANEEAGQTPTRLQVEASTIFKGGEGIVFDGGHMYFTTKIDGRVWDYDIAEERIRIVYQTDLDPERQLRGVDNATVSRNGDLLIAEDGGNMELVVLSKNGVAQPLLRVIGQIRSEITGPAFDPYGRRLYFSSQRGAGQNIGITYEITGPFRT